MTSGHSIAIAMMVMNVGTYGFQIVAASLLAPADFGAIGSLLNLLLVISVVSLAIQATAARRIAAEPDHVAAIEGAAIRASTRLALALGVLLLFAAPLISHGLRLDSPSTAALVGLSAGPMTLTGAYAGILQGERRWRPLSWLFMAIGVPRLVVGTGMLLWKPTVIVALIAISLCWVAPLSVGAYALRRRRGLGTTPQIPHGALTFVRESAGNAQALFAIFTLSNIDLLLARNVLSAHDSGLYAAGLIIAKSVLFLPQFVVILAFPEMAREAGSIKALLKSMAAILGAGLVSVAAARLLAPIALLFVGGESYGEIQDDLWTFALLGTVLALLQLTTYAIIANQDTRLIGVVWIAVAALVALVWTQVSTVLGLLWLVVSIDLAVTAAMVIWAVFARRTETAGTIATQ